MDIMSECPFGIHDLSRNGLDPRTSLARFNMPIELGIFLGLGYDEASCKQTKSMIFLDANPRDYEKTASDLKGRDPRIHSNDPDRLITHIREWLRSLGLSGTIPGGKEITRRYRLFLKDIPDLLTQVHLHESEISKPEHFLSWCDLVTEWLAAASF